MLHRLSMYIYNVRVLYMEQYSTAHVKGKRYTRFPWETRGDPVCYTRVSNCLHAGAMRATRTRDRTRVERTRV